MKNEQSIEKPNGYQLIVGIISIEILDSSDGNYSYQVKLNENDKLIEEKKISQSFKQKYEKSEAHKFNTIIKNKENMTIDIILYNEAKQILGKIVIPMSEVADERVNSENVIKETFVMNGEDELAVFKMRLALRKNRNNQISDEQMLDKIQNSAAERLETVKNIEKRGSSEGGENSIFPSKVNPPRKSLYQIEIDAIDQKLLTVPQNGDVYKKLSKEKKLQEKKEKRRIEKTEKILKLYNLPKEESLLTRYFSGHVTNKTTWMSRVGNFYVTQNYLCFKQQLVSFMLTIPLFSIKKYAIKSRTINFEFNGNEYVIFERGLSKRMIKVIEEQLRGYSNSEQSPLLGTKSSSSIVVTETPKKEMFTEDNTGFNDSNTSIEDKEDSITESDEEEFGMLSKDTNHVAFIPDDILETVIENREFNVTPIKFFYILFGDQSNFFQDYLVFKGGGTEMTTSKWGNRENEIGSWRQLDYIAPVPPLPLCPTSTRTNRTQYFHLTKEKLIFEERLTMFDVYFGDKFQVANRIVAVLNGNNKSTVTVKSGVVFVSKVWGWIKTTIITNSRKSGGGEMRGLLESAHTAIEEFINKKSEEKKEKIKRRTVVLSDKEKESLKLVELPQVTQPSKDKNSSSELEKKVSSLSTELDLVKTKLAELQKSSDPLYLRIFLSLVFFILIYLLFFKK
eukprot:TRINITY_DN5331_c0_g1_i1.p1 TRINITY_DN5331_c0_g1~~TRINITY_DN5331_c0_g1_i1.p1  ORF type:complete len:678 (-),score=267.40 TRINITY_DN5331_c0_g1_i1:29-2062(-)